MLSQVNQNCLYSAVAHGILQKGLESCRSLGAEAILQEIMDYAEKQAATLARHVHSPFHEFADEFVTVLQNLKDNREQALELIQECLDCAVVVQAGDPGHQELCDQIEAQRVYRNN